MYIKIANTMGHGLWGSSALMVATVTFDNKKYLWGHGRPPLFHAGTFVFSITAAFTQVFGC